MNTAKISNLTIVEVVKRRANTSIVRDITDYSPENFVVKNKSLMEDPIFNLSDVDAKTVSTIINIKNPEWGVKAFNYNAQQLTDGSSMHTVGTGFNSRLLFNDELSHWRVVTFK